MTFFFHEVDKPAFFEEPRLSSWVKKIAVHYGKPINTLHYIFVSDSFLLGLNKQFLDHDYYTDILTFPQSYDPIEAEIYISLDRVMENAQLHETNVLEEMLRVVIHGYLHMAGYKDVEEKEKKMMRKEENQCISIYFEENEP